MKMTPYFTMIASFILLVGNQLFASEKPMQMKAFEACASEHLLGRFMPGRGNVYSYSTPNTTLIYLEGKVSSENSKVLFVPQWEAYSSKVNELHRTDVEEMKAKSSYGKNGIAISLHYAHSFRGNDPLDSDHDVDVNLEILRGIPTITADRHVTQECKVDGYGRQICQRPQVTYSNVNVVSFPETASIVNWINKDSGLATRYQVNLSLYENCLKAVR